MKDLCPWIYCDKKKHITAKFKLVFLFFGKSDWWNIVEWVCYVPTWKQCCLNSLNRPEMSRHFFIYLCDVRQNKGKVSLLHTIMVLCSYCHDEDRWVVVFTTKKLYPPEKSCRISLTRWARRFSLLVCTVWRGENSLAPDGNSDSVLWFSSPYLR